MFVQHTKNSTIVVLVYVDDIIITENNDIQIANVKTLLKKKFDIKDLEKLKYFLGIEIAHSNKDLFLSQRKYTLDLLKKTKKLGTKPYSTPMDCNTRLNSEDEESLADIGQYQRLIGELIYLTVTRPDISFAVSRVSQSMHAPRTGHLDVVNRILGYLKGSPGQGVWMRKNNSNVIAGYSVADWVGSSDQKSTTGYCTFVGGNLVTWKSKNKTW
jgi:Reverse transcriptase (RNA-dependent DNA polymerase)